MIEDIIARIDALLANTLQSEIEEFEVTRCLRDCRDELIAASTLTDVMLQGTGQRLVESMAERVINGLAVGSWIPVSERLPEEDRLVLVFDPEMGGHGLATYTKSDGWLGEDVALYEPSHWMPLPEPPASPS